MTETIFGKGFNFKRPPEGSPDFVKGKMSIKVSEAIEFLKQYQENDWVNLDLLVSKEKKTLYFKLNQWKKEEKPKGEIEYPKEDINPDNIPF